MPKQKTYTHDELLASAMQQFWVAGYHATSMDDLVKATQVSRHGIYNSFGSKHGLFIACLRAYQTHVVSPAFAAVEAPNAGLDAIQGYFDFQLARAKTHHLPGPGCLVANSMTELAPHDDAVLECVQAHEQRLKTGFLNALHGANAAQGKRSTAELEHLAAFLVTSAQGLWSFSRSVGDAAPLAHFVDTLLSLIQLRIEA